jgi:phosphatidate cytidylyltransferase
MTVIEYGQLINKYTDAHVNIYISALGAGYLFMAFMSYNTFMVSASVFLPYVLLLLYMMISELYLKRENPIGNWAHTMLSQVYIALPFALLNVISFQNDFVSSEVTYNPILPLSVFIFLWMSDTGAYCIGTLIGKHRLFERISPKKSWEGSIGGAVVALIAAAILAHFFNTLNTLEWIGLALTIVVFGTWGDLTESLFKRQLGIKDSGNILPGHGGMLDRFDSALMAIPAATVYLYCISLL